MINFNKTAEQRYSQVDIFSTEGRIGRRSYFVFSIILPFIIFSVIASLAGAIAKLGHASSYSAIINTAAYVVLALAVIALLIMTVRLTIQRCHDFDSSGKFAILALIPFANLIFSLIAGNNGLNSYGEAPQPPSFLIKTGVFILLLLLIGTIGYVTFELIKEFHIIQFILSKISEKVA